MRYLSSPDQLALLDDLAGAGFRFLNEDGTARIPQPFDQASNGTDGCVYLGRVPIDEQGTLSTDFCANVTDCVGITFATERVAPETPYHEIR